MQDKTQIPAIVNENILIKYWNFHTSGLGTLLLMALGNRQTNRSACIEQFFLLERRGIFKINSMSLGFVLLEKLFKQMRTGTLQSEDIMSAHNSTHIKNARSVI